MLEVLKIKHKDVVTEITDPIITIDAGDYIGVHKTDTGLRVQVTDISQIPNTYRDVYDKLRDEYDKLKTSPYLSRLCGVVPDAYGNIWLLGGATSQVDTESADNTYVNKTNDILLCDMSQEDRTPQILRAMYDILRQIRLWIDAYKDTLLCTPASGETQWTAMLAETTTEDAPVLEIVKSGESSDNKYPMAVLKETREERGTIPAIGPSTAIRNEYQSVVALWNYIVAQPKSSLVVRTHPGDSAGIYVALSMNIPIEKISDKTETTVTVTITITPPSYKSSDSSSSSSIPTKMWFRNPICQVIAAGAGTTKTATCTFDPSGSKVDGLNASQLDTEGKVADSGLLTATITATLPNTCSLYTLQAVIDCIPFNLCVRKGEDGNSVYTEVSYADSRQGMHYTNFGQAEWTVAGSYTIGDSTTETTIGSDIKHTTGLPSVCTDTTDFYPEDYEPPADEDGEGTTT